MIAGLAGCGAAVMAGGAGLGDVAVIEFGPVPAQGVVTAVALAASDDMVGRLTRLDSAVMALAAIAHHLAVIKAGHDLPAFRAVTIAAGVGGGHMMQGFAATGNLRTTAMTGSAVHGGALEASIYMAHLAFHKTVKALQRKAGGIMIEAGCAGRAHSYQQQHQSRTPSSVIARADKRHGRLPHMKRGKVTGVVTGIALHAIGTAMNVIRLVALPAFIAAGLQLCQRLSMATVTGQAGVGAGQGESCLFVMIEVPAVPASGMMAAGTLRSQCSLVGIIRFVTADAG